MKWIKHLDWWITGVVLLITTTSVYGIGHFMFGWNVKIGNVFVVLYFIAIIILMIVGMWNNIADAIYDAKESGYIRSEYNMELDEDEALNYEEDFNDDIDNEPVDEQSEDLV